MNEASSGVGFSRLRNRISGRASGSVTQSSSKNWVSVGCVLGGGGGGEADEGTTRMMSATAARRGSVGRIRSVSKRNSQREHRVSYE